MKVSDLIERLQEFDEDAEVHLSYDYGDHWHTTVAPSITKIDEGYVKRSDYHRMDAVCDDDRAETCSDGDARRVIILG